jgi:hypothetical protein
MKIKRNKHKKKQITVKEINIKETKNGKRNMIKYVKRNRNK